MARKRLFWILPAVATLCVFAAPAGALPTRSGGAVRQTNSLALQVVGQINATRRAHGLAPLRVSTRLTAAADNHSRQMARIGYFSHDSADGTSMGDRVRHYYSPGGYRYWAVGENLVWASPSLGAAGAVRMWLNSPPHRANLLSPQWREIGLSALHTAHAPGVYGGREVTIVTADFGVRR